MTICTRESALLFGDVADGSARLNVVGRIAANEWLRTAELRPYVVLDAHVVMPNHVHLLFGLAASPDDGGGVVRHAPATESPRRFGKPAARSVSSLIGAYKSAVTRAANRHWGCAGGTIWQGRFHDRIVRDDAEHQRIRRYILDNPLRWHLDPYKP